MSRADLLELVESWRAVLCPEWRVLLMDKPHPDSQPDTFWAESQTKDDYAEICIHFTDEALARPASDIEVTVVHELLHALTRPWRQQIDSVCGVLGSDAYRALSAARSHEEEQLVDRLSRVLVHIRRRAAVSYGTRPGPTD